MRKGGAEIDRRPPALPDLHHRRSCNRLGSGAQRRDDLAARLPSGQPADRRTRHAQRRLAELLRQRAQLRRPQRRRQRERCRLVAESRDVDAEHLSRKHRAAVQHQRWIRADLGALGGRQIAAERDQQRLIVLSQVADAPEWNALDFEQHLQAECRVVVTRIERQHGYRTRKRLGVRPPGTPPRPAARS